MEEKLVIEGEPIGKQRPKASFRQHRIYTPEKTINYENYVRYCYYGHSHFGDRPIEIDLNIFLPIPSSISNKRKELMKSGTIRPTKKPDIDNCIKSILDGLNGVAYEDDKQVVKITSSKYYGVPARVEVTIKDCK